MTGPVGDRFRAKLRQDGLLVVDTEYTEFMQYTCSTNTGEEQRFPTPYFDLSLAIPGDVTRDQLARDIQQLKATIRAHIDAHKARGIERLSVALSCPGTPPYDTVVVRFRFRVPNAQFMQLVNIVSI